MSIKHWGGRGMTASVFDVFYVTHCPHHIIGQWAIIFSSSCRTSGYISYELIIPCCLPCCTLVCHTGVGSFCNAESKWWIRPISYVSTPLPLALSSLSQVDHHDASGIIRVRRCGAICWLTRGRQVQCVRSGVLLHVGMEVYKLYIQVYIGAISP
jgi:hypothetical protein